MYARRSLIPVMAILILSEKKIRARILIMAWNDIIESNQIKELSVSSEGCDSHMVIFQARSGRRPCSSTGYVSKL